MYWWQSVRGMGTSLWDERCPPQWVFYIPHHLDHIRTHILSCVSLGNGGRWFPKGLVQLHRPQSGNTEQMMNTAWMQTKQFDCRYQDGPVGASRWKPSLFIWSSGSQPGDCWQCLGTFLVILTGGGCYWPLVGRGQGHYCIFYNEQDSPFPKCQECWSR